MQILTLLSEYGVESTISLPSREEPSNGRLVVSCVNRANVRALDVIIKYFVITQKLSDHYFVGCRLDSFAGGGKSNEGSRRSVSVIDTSKLYSLTAAHDWDDFLLSTDPTCMYTCCCCCCCFSNFEVILDCFKEARAFQAKIKYVMA